jgi:NAD+ synthase
MPDESVDNLLRIDPAKVERYLCRFISTRLRRAKFHRAVLGISGGLDSAIVAALCARALGPENVLGVTMPYKTSSPATLRDSQTIIKLLGIQTIDVPITAQTDAYFAQVGEPSRLRLANMCARQRMTVLFDQSAVFEGLVIGTSNKSEILLGYGTQFGDLAAAVNPVGDLYKTQLRRLAVHLDIPRQIREKPPTADLWVGQTDEGELGMTYAEADRLLVRMVDHHWPRAKLLRAGFSAELIDRATTLIRRNRFKRRLPTIAKLKDL